MGLINCASGNSIWRGYDYFKEKKVSMLVPTDNDIVVKILITFLLIFRIREDQNVPNSV